MHFAVEYDRLANSSQFMFVPLEPQDILDFDADTSVPEMHDRMITGVARRFTAICLSRDPAIKDYPRIATLWD